MNALYDERSRILKLTVFFVAFILLARLFYVQVIDEDYKQSAEANALRKVTVFPARGLILDRNGKMMVRNETIYDIMVTETKTKDLDTQALCNILDVSLEDFRLAFDKAKKSRDYARYKPFPIIRQISKAQYGKLQERLYQFRGFYVQQRAARSYPRPVAAHAIGYLGEVNDLDISGNEGYYRMGDYIGKSGLEKQYEEILRGQKGIKHILVDVLNREQGSYSSGEFDVAAVPGQDVITGINREIQEYAEYLMNGKLGSVVAIEPSTGEILAMVSSPAYDPNLLQGRQRRVNYPKLIMDNSKPMFNRAISAQYPPGSTLKPVEALFALQEGLIHANYSYTCNGGYRIGGHTVGCHSAGTFDVANSIRLSCNSYYCHIFKLIVDQPGKGGSARGLETWQKRLHDFGSGIELGIDIPNESKGIVPGPKYYDKFYGENRWRSTTIISLGIGQAEISLTPLQMANNAAVIANRGHFIVPHFVRAIKNIDGTTETLNWQKKETGIDLKHYELIADAMQMVVDNGTAAMARLKGIEVCGKTGTAQNPHGKDHALFIAFAPKVNPKIAICVVVENAGYGGTWAAPIASLVMEKYLTDTIARPYIEKHVLDAYYLKPKPEIVKTNVKTPEAKKDE